MFRKFQAVQKDNNPGATLARFIKKFYRQLVEMQPGDTILAPGGWRFPVNGRPQKHDLVALVECTADKDADGEPLYRMVVCNTGPGLEYHPVKPSVFPPKFKYKNSIVIKVCDL